MPNRLTRTERKWAYLYLVARDGEYCLDCKLGIEELTRSLEIDHIDEDAENWDPDNLALRCHSCNASKSNRARSHAQLGMLSTNGHSPSVKTLGSATRKSSSRRHKMQPDSAGPSTDFVSSPCVQKCVCVCDKTPCVCDRTDVPGSRNMQARRRAIDSESGSPEMHANGLYEDLFRKWIVDYVQSHAWIARKDALNAGAELTGGSPMSMRRYLDKLTSIAGPLVERKDGVGKVVIVSRFGQE